MSLEHLLQMPPYVLPQADKTAALLPLLQELTDHHRAHCPAYCAITTLTAPHRATTLAELPYLPITLFKFRNLRSVPPEAVRVTVQSSGTGGQRSRVELDADTAKLSSRALAASLARVIPASQRDTEITFVNAQPPRQPCASPGGQRLPMLIIDTPSAIKCHDNIGARAAAILGLMPYGRDHVFALDDDLQLRPDMVTAFLDKYRGQNILLYGFTFLIWQVLLPACRAQKFDLSKALLLHSGGWKKLESEKVDHAEFRRQLHAAAGLQHIRNFYGMAELPGVIFMEGDDGLLYPPNFADVLIRDPITRQPVPDGMPGLVQIFSALPRSFPGHVLLTEDIGMIAAHDGGGMAGAGLKLLGRAPRAELRGCSDVIAGVAA